MNTGKIIVVEGSGDGIGKTTQYNILKEHLINDGYEVATHHFPTYNTYQGKPVEMYLKGIYGTAEEMSPYFINSLYALDRAITWQTEVKEKYENGNIILLDRYTTSSIIYQASTIKNIEERKKFIDYVSDFEYNKLGIGKPDDVIFLHAPFELTTKIRQSRIENEGIKNDIHESNLNYMKKVYDNSMLVANYLNWTKIKCYENNEMKSIEEIHENIYKKVKKMIK